MYPLMSLIGNMGPILSGATMAFVAGMVAKRVQGEEAAFETSLKVLTGFMGLAGLFVAGLHHFIRQQHQREMQVLRGQQQTQMLTEKPGVTSTTKPKKPSLTLWQSIKFLASNEYLLNVATMVLSYGLTIEFTEIIWKASVKAAFPAKNDYLNFMGRYSTLVGSAATVMMFIGARIVKGLGWRAGALTTPLMMGLLALPFFGILSFGDMKDHRVLLIAVYIGLLQNVVSKATKYAIFDPTKEIAYIPLDAESKTSGKAAIDVLGARVGKSGGAFSQQLLVMLCGSIFHCAPYLSVLFYLSIFLWTRKPPTHLICPSLRFMHLPSGNGIDHNRRGGKAGATI